MPQRIRTTDRYSILRSNTGNCFDLPSPIGETASNRKAAGQESPSTETVATIVRNRQSLRLNQRGHPDPFDPTRLFFQTHLADHSVSRAIQLHSTGLCSSTQRCRDFFPGQSGSPQLGYLSFLIGQV